MNKVVISGTGLFTPPEKISNQELVSSFNIWVDQQNSHKKPIPPLQKSSTEFIKKASGVENRYVINKSGILDPNIMKPQVSARKDDEPSIQCEMALNAAEKALAQANINAREVDMILVACSCHQRSYPSIATEVQHFIGAGGFAFDMNMACSSATFALQVAFHAISMGSATRALILNPEITTTHMNFRDRDSHFIFGDACTAIVVEQKNLVTSDNTFKILDTYCRTQFSNNIRNNHGILTHCEPKGGTLDFFRQNGRKVFKEVCPQVIAHITEQLESNHLSASDMKRLWLHQANINMNQRIAKKILNRQPDNQDAPIILDQFANTASAGSIIAFHKHSSDFHSGEKGIICSFGAGYSVGSVLLEKC
ncbi:Beta-ketodecanoyl-[acyl-carrier-protein] synthase [invertebrate metagenome]|uniref:Beta-ketodecanoyl-[acyl-carrier-protein] synthase n=1 Tax=invertebrate metagenome TaxID=1711999 RepID=A0A2H9TC66_9ZZZZ